MKTVCVYTQRHSRSRRLASRCVRSAKDFGIHVERLASVYWTDIRRTAKQLGLRLRLQPHQRRVTTATHCPAFRIANGLSHYQIYVDCLLQDEPVCVVEHDALFVGPMPATHPDGVTQISSHRLGQMDSEWYRHSKTKHVPEGPEPDFTAKGIIPHPYAKAVGTSGYIITPEAAGRMVAYTLAHGVAYADHLRRDIVKDLWLAIPQPVETTNPILRYYKDAP